MMEKAVLTIATGKKVYLNMAVALARSFKWWHPNNNIKFVLVTDQKSLIPKDLNDIEIVEVTQEQIGIGFSSKLYLDLISPAQKTLFIDADCLIFGSLEPVFKKFENYSISVIGNLVNDGEWFGNIKDICTNFKVKSIPKFNGGVYYFEKGVVANNVYKKARELEPRYDDIGLVRLRNRPNDELLMSISMAIYNQTPVIDDGTIMSDPQACPGNLKIDVLNGYTSLENPPIGQPNHCSWYPFHKVSPIIVHFLGYYTNDFPYQSETFKLELIYAYNIPAQLSNFIAIILIYIPGFLIKKIKNISRPLYRILFGYRKIPKSDRIV